MQLSFYQILTLLVPAFPVLGFLIHFFAGSAIKPAWSGVLASFWVLLSFALSVLLFVHIDQEGPQQVVLFEWIHTAEMHLPFAFYIDHLSSIMMMLITGVGGLIHVYSTGYMHGDRDFNRYFSYLNLFVFFMLLLVMGDNFIVLFAGWEGVGLCSYLLIGFWYENHDYNKAANKALIINRIGDLALLLGIFMLFQQTGSFSFSAIQQFLSPDANVAGSTSIPSSTIFWITLLLFIGATGKSAQIPLFTWLPDAMAGPTPVSALIHAATMVTAGIYLILRNQLLFSMSPETLDIILYTGLLTSLMAGIIALKQTDCKKILAYSTVSQLGLMFFALGLGAGNAAFFHLLTHAFFKALLFLAAGSVIHALHGEQDIRKMGGLKAYLPVTRWVFLAGVLAIIALPPFSGFFSKDAILLYAYQRSPVLWALGLISGLITAWYMVRLYLLIFYGNTRMDAYAKASIHDAPASMAFPLVILALLSITGGLLNVPALFHGNQWLDNTLSGIIAFEKLSLSHATEWILMTISVSLILLLAWLAYRLYHIRQHVPSENEDVSPVVIINWVKQKFYIDALYERVITRPAYYFAGFLTFIIDKKGIDGLVEGSGGASQFLASKWRETQNGFISYYLFAMALGMLGILVIYIVL